LVTLLSPGEGEKERSAEKKLLGKGTLPGNREKSARKRGWWSGTPREKNKVSAVYERGKKKGEEREATREKNVALS